MSVPRLRASPRHSGAITGSWKTVIEAAAKAPAGAAVPVIMGYGGITPHHESSGVISSENIVMEPNTP